MRIKKLELCGFKSFKDRTVIHFDEGITGVVGPNGCGKSNIVDALVWVMGEMSAKHLRGASMEDVIFAGAEGYAPVGMAEVNLTLENDGGPFPVKYAKFSEVMITRRLYRSGESEYLINKEPARLRDIQEIFMDTGAGAKGFSIVEQGAIGKIITAKPEDRRTLIEEAAGITKFKVRKRESQRKLESTEQNLIRLQDIIGEQKRHLDSLQRQAQRAERYRNLRKEAQEKELWISSRQYLQMHQEAEEAQRIFTESQVEEEAAKGNLAGEESELQTLKLQELELEKQVEEQQVRHQEKMELVQRLEHEIRELQFEIEQARRTEEVTGQIKHQYQAREQALQSELTKLTEQFATADAMAKEVAIVFQEKSEKLKVTQEQIKTVDQDLTARRREMLATAQSETHIDVKALAMNDKVEESKNRLTTAEKVAGELTAQKEEFEKRRNQLFAKLEGERQMQLDIGKDVDTYAANLQIVQTQMTEKNAEVEKFKDELNQVASRLYGLENLQANFEGFEEGVRNVMQWHRTKQVPRADGSVDIEFRPVSEVIEVPEEYELAMEAALGNRLQLLLSQSADSALGALGYLKEQKQGRSSFATSEWLEASDAPMSEQIKAEPGVRGLMHEIAQIPEDYQKQVRRFLSSIVVVDDLQTALRLRRQHAQHTFVTIDGDTLNSDGILTGGAATQAETGLLKRRREIKELSLKREEWAGKLALAQASQKKLDAQVKSLQSELENTRKRQNEKELEVVALKKDLERAETELVNAQRALDKQSQELAREMQQLQTQEEELETLRERLAELREQKATLESQVNELSAQFDQARSGVEDLSKEVTLLQVDSTAKSKDAESAKWQLEMVQKSLAEVTEQLGKMNLESDKNAQSLSSNQVTIEHKKVEFERLARESEENKKNLSSMRNSYEELSTRVRSIESAVSTKMHAMHALKTRMGEAQIKFEQMRMKEKYLVDQTLEKYMLNLSEVAQQYAAMEGDLAEFESALVELKEKLNKIGDVNMAAIQEYDELITRYEFLNKQFQDLTDAKEQLKKVIDRINRICAKRFKETFTHVNDRFTKVFPVLFGGGEAQLILVEDPEKDELGIDIVARPPGKKLQNVSLLSGGEKALTAVSLIFSIFLVKPSPFCLLDEVDAPLDDANVFRFNDLVKEMAKRSQIIVVTHNKHTMKVNNKLYGVTMEEKGVSKMVSVSLEEAARVVGS